MIDKTKVIFGLLIVGSAIAAFAISFILSPPLAVKSMYTTIGFSTSLGILWYVGSAYANDSTISAVNQVQYQKLTIIIACVSIILLIFGPILVVYLFLIPIGYASLIYQFITRNDVTKGMIFQLVILFFINSYSKIETTYFYIGNLDLIKHTKYINDLLSEGDPSAITSSYSSFPGLHVLSGSLSIVADIQPHGSILMIGTLSFAALLGALYTYIKVYTSSVRIAYLSVIFLSVSEGYLFFSNYFFPQSLALVLVFFLIFIATSSSKRSQSAFVIAGIPLVFFLIVTHHFTLLLILPVLFILYIFDIYAKIYTDSKPYISSLNWTLILSSYLLALYYWGYDATEFLNTFVVISTSVLRTFTSMGVNTGSGGENIYYLGINEGGERIVDSLGWLFGINGVYQSLLISILSLGFVKVLQNISIRQNMFPLACLGFLGSVLVLDTPLSVTALIRLAFPLSIFVFIVAGYGTYEIIGNYEIRKGIPIIILIFVFSATGSMVAADDVQNYSGTEYPNQASISEEEYRQLESVAKFNNQYGKKPLSSFSVTQEMLELFGTTANSELSVQNSSLDSTNKIVYNENWPRYQLRHNSEGPYLSQIRMSEEWLQEDIDRSNKIYDSKEIGITETN
ncbi:hypothetical protein [Natrinema versiforme]|uniref:hypothetical protein n=1 Tax=Natrinema versiforme TaxID=88724 RepID=UPI000B0ADC30|nr:hypothetical protein [Natrinema versiforme]